MDRKILRIKEVSALTGVPVWTLRSWRHQTSAGKPAGPVSFKLGGSVVYDLAAVEAWIDEQRHAGAAAS